MRLFILLAFICLLQTSTLNAQTKNSPGKELHVKPITGTITLDGTLDEPDWQSAQIATDFFQNYPVDSLPPTFQSEVRITFNEHFIYFGIVCHDDNTRDMVQSLRRDISWELNDNIGIYFDPFNDFTNGFFFTITPMGVQSEGIISNGASDEDSFNDNWDNKWYSKVKRYPDRWIAELAIPLKSIRYNRTNWNMTFLRNDVKRNQISSWIATPVQFIPASMAYAGKVVWEGELPKPTRNISFIPYLSAASNKDSDISPDPVTSRNAGFDAKVSITPSLNLDLTVNPDFSQVEVDRQVINLTRFEFGFPERRQFFLENSDLFSGQAFPFSRPFFSRRIGIASDSSGLLHRVPIDYGARLSGKLGRHWRIGVLNMQTRKNTHIGLPTQNYLVGVIQRQVFSRSNIGFTYVHKQNVGIDKKYDPSKFYHASLIREIKGQNGVTKQLNQFNDVFGVDFNLITKTNDWSGDFYYHRSAESFNQDENYSFGMFLGYNKRNYSIQGAFYGLGKNYNAETGFVPILEVYPGNFGGFVGTGYRMFPKHKTITQMNTRLELNFGMIPGGTITDKGISLSYDFNWINTSFLRLSLDRTYQLLPEDFNPLDPVGNQSLVAGTEYGWTTLTARYQTNTRKILNAAFSGSYGGFYNGRLLNMGGEFNIRYQPYGSLTAVIDYNKLDFPSDFGSARFILVGPRMDITFSDKLFLTTFVQYNNRAENLNVNARFQWRFKPASDLFVVYTENYLPGAYTSKNRALVLKLTYWLNL